MMRVKVLVGVALAVTLSACGSSDGDATPAEDVSGSGGSGAFFGQCGSVGDQEVLDAFAVQAFTSITRNSVGCEWETAGFTGPSVSFSWYRGSPIDRERSGSELIGRPAQDIEIDGQAGFAAATEDYLCEIGVQYGDDFIHWSVTYGDLTPMADPCDVAMQLAELTVERAR
ncbi:DUF3558 domain-containing protein [Rhodococcus sp. I2R]|uniref:DUF3558 domain-containing protein n=1 Tax=Rhodococcus sp. I2R TaxID=2855445 RepID=UPI001E4ADE9A|nr:DUF3558 domain-containing protein [Rhodococcus sp. I2R]MCC8928704.1 DUF3558 domain-containing protein [Rhodococcus sp. I2R]